MSMNEPDRQVEIGDALFRGARALAVSTRQFPHRSDTYRLIGVLSGSIADLAQVCRQLGAFHADARDGQDYDGEDPGGSGRSAQEAAAALKQAATALAAAEKAVAQAHSANSHIRWSSEP
ncbi:hypothetical protein [Dietzia maris]|uniref:hypothetical protein n=1 Tax=Dietzia maris TaxID=37915 RepID=UPI0037CB5F82